MSFFASLGIKDALYGLLIAALAAGGLWWHHQIILEGEAKITKADKHASDLQLAHDADVQNAAVAAYAKARAQYDASTTAPPPVAPSSVPVVRLCYQPRNTISLSTTASGIGSGQSKTDSGAADTAIAAGPDLVPRLLEIGRNADALITALQEENAALRAEMTK